MAAFTKDVLYPGKYQLADGRWVEFTPQDSAHFAQRAKDMIAAGLSIPVAWEHQEVAPRKADRAKWLEEREKGTLGWVDDAQVGEQSILGFKVEVPVAGDAERLPAVRYVSPEIQEDWRDGTGKVWPGKSITHVAVTSRPVQPGQKAFQRLSQQGQQNGKRVRLSLGDMTMAEETEKKPEGDKPDKPADGGGTLAELVEALRQKGINVPEMATTLKEVTIAVLASGEADDGEGLDETAANEAIAEGAPPVMLSLVKESIRTGREGLEGRIKGLKGRIGQPLVDELLAELRTVRLSLDGQGRIKAGSLGARIAAYEKLAGGFATGGRRSRLSMATEQAEPADDTRDRREKQPETPTEVKGVLDDIDAMMGRK